MMRTIWTVVTPRGTQAILSLLGTLSSSPYTRKPSVKPCTQPRQVASRWMRAASLFASLSMLEQTSKKSRPDLLISGSSDALVWPVLAGEPTTEIPNSAEIRSRRIAASHPSMNLPTGSVLRLMGITVLGLAAMIMPWLAAQKRRLSVATGSAALRAGAAESAVRGYLALIALRSMRLGK
jgi:hypothetical protein